MKHAGSLSTSRSCYAADLASQALSPNDHASVITSAWHSEFNGWAPSGAAITHRESPIEALRIAMRGRVAPANKVHATYPA